MDTLVWGYSCILSYVWPLASTRKAQLVRTLRLHKYNNAGVSEGGRKWYGSTVRGGGPGETSPWIFLKKHSKYPSQRVSKGTKSLKGKLRQKFKFHQL